MNICEMQEKLTKNLFPRFFSEDEHFLALGLCGEVGELANKIKKRWRDGVDLSDEIREEICDVRIYLELIAKCFGIEGDKLDAAVEAKLRQVAERTKQSKSHPTAHNIAAGNVAASLGHLRAVARQMATSANLRRESGAGEQAEMTAKAIEVVAQRLAALNWEVESR